MILNTSQVLQLKLGGAVATTELPIYAAWADVRRDSVELLPGSASYASTGATAVTVLPAASSQFLRQLKYLSAYNADTAPVDVIVQVLDGATVRRVCLVTLPVGATLEYTPDKGWHAVQFGADLAGVVVDSIADADTVNAPSRNAVFDALALKLSIASAASTYQPLDSDLTAIAAIAPANDDIIQRKAGAWTNRTLAQLKSDISLSGTNTGDQTITLTGDVTGSGTGSFAATLATAQPAVHTWALAQTFTVAPVFTDAAGSRDSLKIGPRYCYEALADFASGNVSATVLGTEWGTSASGTGAQLTALVGLTSGNSAGRAVLTLGTTTTGRAAVLTATLTHALGAGAVQFVLKGAMESLSDATDTFVQRLGIMDSVSAEPTNGCYFRYTHSVNSGKWECVTRAAGVETATDSGITAVAGTERNWQIKVNAAGTSVEFYIDGALKQTHSTNIPTARIGFAAAAIRSAGTAAKNALGMDLIYTRIDFTTPRW